MLDFHISIAVAKNSPFDRGSIQIGLGELDSRLLQRLELIVISRQLRTDMLGLPQLRNSTCTSLPIGARTINRP